MDERLILPGEAAELLGVSMPMLAYYEQKGVLKPAMRLKKNGRWGLRIYRLEDVMRLARERRAAEAVGKAGNGRGAARVLESAK